MAGRGSLIEPNSFWKEPSLRPIRLVPDGTAIPFMRGRFAGVITSAVLSIMSVVLFFYPGLNLGVDFRGGVVVARRGPQALPADTIREAFAPLGFGDLRVQEFGSPRDVLVRFDNKTQLQDAQRMIAARVAEALPKVEIRRVEVVGARVSGELFRNGLLATALALVAVLFYIWFLYLVSLRVAVRCRCRRHPDPRRDKDGRLLRRHADRIRPQFGGGTIDPDRLLGHRQGRGLRPYPGESRQISDDAVARAHRPQHQPDPRPHGRHIADRRPLDPAPCDNWRRSDARLWSGDHFRDHHRHLLLDLHRLADPAVPRRKTAAAGGGSCSSAEQLRHGTIEDQIKIGAVAPASFELCRQTSIYP